MKATHALAQKLGLNHKQREALIRMERLQGEMRQKIDTFKAEKKEAGDGEQYTHYGFFENGYKNGSKVFMGPGGASYYISSKTFTFQKVNKADYIHIRLNTAC